MERGNTRNKKRTREEGDENGGAHKAMRPETKIVKRDFSDDDRKNKQYHEFLDGIGVFDFPWLKEGVIFIADEYFEAEEKFAPSYSYLDEVPATFAANPDQSCVQNLFDLSIHDKGLDNYWPLGIDDFEPVDCIWRCMIDQPIDIGLNKR